MVNEWDLINQSHNIMEYQGYLYVVGSFDDVNQDGIWNVIDIILIMNHILSINPLTNSQLINADLNNDGIVDILDIINLVNIILSQ